MKETQGIKKIDKNIHILQEKKKEEKKIIEESSKFGYYIKTNTPVYNNQYHY